MKKALVVFCALLLLVGTIIAVGCGEEKVEEPMEEIEETTVEETVPTTAGEDSGEEAAAVEEAMREYAYSNRGSCEDVWVEDVEVSSDGKEATARVRGMITAHTDPERAGETVYWDIEAEMENGVWTVTSFEETGGGQ